MIRNFRRLKRVIRAVKLARGLTETVSDDYGVYRFHCNNEGEMWRARSLLTKEAGTIAWLNDFLRAGETFYDVGANIGLYSVVASQRVGKTGHVVAFEPHLANARSLLQNIGLNALSDRSTVLSCALHNQDGFFPFYYHHESAGSSQSQLGSPQDDQGATFAPVAVEIKAAFRLDSLLRNGVILPPNHVKIDVDGNEILVLQGMTQLLTQASLRSLQIEINPARGQEIHDFLAQYNFHLHKRHDTEFGQSKIAAGEPPENVSHNAIFCRE